MPPSSPNRTQLPDARRAGPIALLLAGLAAAGLVACFEDDAEDDAVGGGGAEAAQRFPGPSTDEGGACPFCPPDSGTTPPNDPDEPSCPFGDCPQPPTSDAGPGSDGAGCPPFAPGCNGPGNGPVPPPGGPGTPTPGGTCPAPTTPARAVLACIPGGTTPQYPWEGCGISGASATTGWGVFTTRDRMWTAVNGVYDDTLSNTFAYLSSQSRLYGSLEGVANPWDTASGVTAAFAGGTQLQLYSVDRVWTYDGINGYWILNHGLSRPVSDFFGPAATYPTPPAINGKKPWNDAGITAVLTDASFFADEAATIFVSKDKMWKLNTTSKAWDQSWVTDFASVIAKNKWPAPPTFGGQLGPWAGAGVTAAYVEYHSDLLQVLRLVSGERVWTLFKSRDTKGGPVTYTWDDGACGQGSLRYWAERGVFLGGVEPPTF